MKKDYQQWLCNYCVGTLKTTRDTLWCKKKKTLDWKKCTLIEDGIKGLLLPLTDTETVKAIDTLWNEFKEFKNQQKVAC